MAAVTRLVPKKRKSTSKLAASKAPWIDGDIDYGPAVTAARDLAVWALDLAARDVGDWAEARKRIRNTRRFVLARIAGKDRRMPVEDVIFTASLLARIFDDELDLDLADSFEIFGALDLPTDVVPVRAPTRAQPMSPRSFVPPPLRLCPECGHVHELGQHLGYRNAA
ncbi:MAG: hypothetical protein QM831_21415 [Kofleriaceae bacterium]